MSFQTEIYPLRNRPDEAARILLRKVDQEFTQIADVPGFDRQTLGGRRCHLRLNQGPMWQQLLGMGSSQMVCDYSATLTDKNVVKALLRGMLRDLSDRYLDFAAVRQFAHRRFAQGAQEAFQTIRQNAPQGAVKFLYNELRREPALFGNMVPADMTYNRWYTSLLDWDDHHCFGLVAELSRLNNVLSNGGGGATAPAYQAAQLWIFSNQTENRRSIYHAVAGGA